MATMLFCRKASRYCGPSASMVAFAFATSSREGGWSRASSSRKRTRLLGISGIASFIVMDGYSRARKSARSLRKSSRRRHRYRRLDEIVNVHIDHLGAGATQPIESRLHDLCYVGIERPPEGDARDADAHTAQI